MILKGHPYIDAQDPGIVAQLARRLGDAVAVQRFLAALPQGIGYWRAGSDDTADLPDPADFVDERWDGEERSMVLSWVRSAPRDAEWRFLGYSWCRLRCGIRPEALGTGEQSDGQFIWPVGFAHYLAVHAVRPPKAFIDHVRARTAASP